MTTIQIILLLVIAAITGMGSVLDERWAGDGAGYRHRLGDIDHSGD